MRASGIAPKNGTKWFRRYEEYPARVLTSSWREGSQPSSAYSRNVMAPPRGSIHVPSATFPAAFMAAFSASRLVENVPAVCFSPWGSRYRPWWRIEPEALLRLVTQAMAALREARVGRTWATGDDRQRPVTNSCVQQLAR